MLNILKLVNSSGTLMNKKNRKSHKYSCKVQCSCAKAKWQWEKNKECLTISKYNVCKTVYPFQCKHCIFTNKQNKRLRYRTLHTIAYSTPAPTNSVAVVAT